METLIRNLWMLLTLAIPGMTTYGTFRLLLVLYDCRTDRGIFEKMDASSLLTTCLIVAIALVQQAIALGIEAVASFVCTRCRSIDRRYYSFFCERFKLASSGKLNEDATRIFANFFASLNITIGQLMIMGYLYFRGLNFTHPALRIVTVLALVGLVSSSFRLHNATSVIPLYFPETDSSKQQVDNVPMIDPVPSRALLGVGAKRAH